MNDKFVLTEDEQRADKLELRWTHHIPEERRLLLANQIDILIGVEKLYIHRYSLEVFIAPHVTSRESIARHIHELLPD